MLIIRTEICRFPIRQTGIRDSKEPFLEKPHIRHAESTFTIDIPTDSILLALSEQHRSSAILFRIPLCGRVGISVYHHLLRKGLLIITDLEARTQDDDLFDTSRPRPSNC